MWSKQQTVAELPAVSPSQGSAVPVAPFNSASNARLGGMSARSSSRLGPSIEIKGQLNGAEDLQIDGKVDGPISLHGHELTVGPTAQLNSEIHAGELAVSGKVVGNVHVRGRVEIKKDGSIIGDIFSARISIEDGAYFKGRIEIDPTKSRSAAD
jgi:cytoskeletal protein CcmA (bactofilin family)